MSSVLVSPQVLATAAQDLSGIGQAIRSATTAAGGSTTQVVAAAQDEVSAAVSAVFGGFGQRFQGLSAQAGLFHDQFVQALGLGGLRYAAAEAANSSPLQALARDAQSGGVF